LSAPATAPSAPRGSFLLGCNPVGTWGVEELQYISVFESLDDAESWIKNEAQGWLRALETQL
jgi:hypothetical protein